MTVKVISDLQLCIFMKNTKCMQMNIAMHAKIACWTLHKWLHRYCKNIMTFLGPKLVFKISTIYI